MLVCSVCFSNDLDLTVNTSKCRDCGGDGFIETDPILYEAFGRVIDKNGELQEKNRALLNSLGYSMKIPSLV